MIDLLPSEPQYPLREWFEDLQACMRGAGSGLVEHFALRYPDLNVRRWRLARLIAATKYLAKNREALDRDSLGIMGKDQFVLTHRAIIGLWIHWARPEIDPDTYEPPTEEFINTCEILPGDKGSPA